MDSVSTGEVARMLMVTRDAVLKWIKQGKVPAYKTPGGHHRIPMDFVHSLVPLKEKNRPTHYVSPDKGKQSKYCWEYHATGEELRDECRSCLVFKVKGTKCYEVAEFLKKMDAGAACCPSSCEDCSFYKEQLERGCRVLVITGSQTLTDALRGDSHNSFLNLKFTDWVYEAGFLVNSFRPQFVVVDLSDEADLERCTRLCEHMHQIPDNRHLAIIQAVPQEVPWFESSEAKFPVIFKPFDISDLEKHITKEIQRTSDAGTSLFADLQNY